MTKKRNRQNNQRSTQQMSQPVNQEMIVNDEIEQEGENVNEEQEIQENESEVQDEILESQEETGDQIEGVTSSPEVIKDDVTPKVPVVDPVVPTAFIAPQVEEVEEEVSSSAITPKEEDSETVSALKIQLNALHKALSIPGKTPEEFKAAAKLTSTITKHVIKYPKPQILDTLLAFFVEHKDSVCSARQFMKGSTTLGAKEEQQVGYLYGLFSDIANKRVVRINDSLVIQVLGKAEIVAYYNKKMAAIKSGK